MNIETIGVISDTHGLVRPEVIDAFKGVGAILHAGDIGGPEVLEALREIAPVSAVRGNNDQGEWAGDLSEKEVLELAGIRLYLLHDLKSINPEEMRNVKAAKIRGIISGHSHRPLIEEKEGILFINPGSAGPRRFKLPISIGFIRIHGTDLKAEIKTLL